MLAFLPGLYLLGLIDLHRRFLGACKYTVLPFVALTIGTVIHYFSVWYLVIVLRMGIKGVGIAGALMNGVIFII